MKDPARTSNAVVVGEDTPCWSGTRRHEHLNACAAHAAARAYARRRNTSSPPVVCSNPGTR